MDEIERFIVDAKAACYVANGLIERSSRPESHDLSFHRDDWAYLDSYYGGTDFLGQEVVWHSGNPVWAMNYYGRVTDAALIDAERAGAVIKSALSDLYRQGRFLGGFACHVLGFDYVDRSDGNYRCFSGVERILKGGLEAYRLDYNGGLIRP